jgi:hypothetical protein
MIGCCVFLPVVLAQGLGCTTILAVVLLLLETIRAIFDNKGASAYSTTVGDCFLDHTPYTIFTYFSSTTKTL